MSTWGHHWLSMSGVPGPLSYDGRVDTYVGSVVRVSTQSRDLELSPRTQRTPRRVRDTLFSTLLKRSHSDFWSPRVTYRHPNELSTTNTYGPYTDEWKVEKVYTHLTPSLSRSYDDSNWYISHLFDLKRKVRQLEVVGMRKTNRSQRFHTSTPYVLTKIQNQTVQIFILKNTNWT